MIITSISVKNFFRYGNSEQTLNITQSGLTSVVANNGIGKTSILCDAPIFAFYGKYRQKLASIDDVVNFDTKKNCKVSVEFKLSENSPDTYKVIRYRAHETQKNNVFIFKNNEDISGHTASATNAIIQNIIKIPYIAFVNSCIFSSDLYQKFLAVTPAERLVVFENILSLKEVTALYIKAQEFVKKTDKELLTEQSINNGYLHDAESNSNAILSYNNNVKTKLLNLKARKEGLESQKKAYKAEIDKFGKIDVQSELDKNKNRALKAEFTKQLAKLDKEIKEISDSITENENKVSEYTAYVKKYKDVDFEIEHSKEEKYNSSLEDIKNKQKQSDDLYKQLLEKKTDYAVYSNNISTLSSQIKTKKAALSMVLEAKCPECGQTINAIEVASKKNKLEKEISELTESSSKATNEYLNIDKILKELKNSKLELDNEINSIKSSLDTNFIKDAYSVKEKVDLINSQLESLYNKIDVDTGKKKDLINEGIRIADESKQLEISDYSDEELAQINEKVGHFEELIDSINKEIIEINASVKGCYDVDYVNSIKKAIKEATDLKTESDAKIAKLTEDKKYFTYLQDSFSNKSGGFKKYFINNKLDFFNERINSYLAFFFGGDASVEITFDKDLYETIKLNGHPISYSGLSKGQKNRAEMSISFALFNLARTFYDNDCNLVIFDEMEDGLDNSGIDSMVEMLKAFSSENHVYLVSHNNYVKEKIDDKVTVKLGPTGFSELG